MKALIVHPGPAASVTDVHNGWCKGLATLGVEVCSYDLGSRLWYYQNSYLERDGEHILAMPFETAVEMAVEAVGAWIYEQWPDLVIVISGFFIREKVCDLIRRRGQKLVLICTESPYEDDAQLQRAAHADLVVLNDPTNLERFRAATDAIYIPHSYDPDLHRPGPADPARSSDVCIVGTGYQSRVDWLEQVDWTDLDLALLGNWESLEHHPLRPAVRQEHLGEIVDNPETVGWYRAARSSLNLYRREAQRPELSSGWSMGPREIELAATGTFFMTEPRGENVEVLPMVPKIVDPAGYADALRWWLCHDDERRDVIDGARAALAGWTFEHRAQQLLAHVA